MAFDSDVLLTQMYALDTGDRASMRTGTVLSIDPIAGTISVDVAGSTLLDVPYSTGVFPKLGATIWIIAQGTWFAAIAAASSTGQIAGLDEVWIGTDVPVEQSIELYMDTNDVGVGAGWGALDDRYVESDGDHMTGVLFLPRAILEGISGSGSFVEYNASDVRRWQVGRSGTPETGVDNEGSDFTVEGYDDGGQPLGAALTIRRATRAVEVALDPVVDLGVATKRYVDTAPGRADQPGRNRIINGDFSINQRAFYDTGVSGGYGLDRWYWTWVGGGGGRAYGARPTAPATGLPEAGKTCAGIGSSGVTDPASYTTFGQKMEGARTLSGKQVTVSFYARTDTAEMKVGVQLVRNFGTGGSPNPSEYFDLGVLTLTAEGIPGPWQRYSVSGSIPAWEDQVEGTAGDSRLTLLLYTSAGPNAAVTEMLRTIGVQNGNIHFWGVQVEEGAVATNFEYRSPAQNLRDCQRYYLQYAVLSGWVDGAAGGVYAVISIPDLPSMRPGPKATTVGQIVVAATGATLATNAVVNAGGGQYSGSDTYVPITGGQPPGAWLRWNTVVVNGEL